MINEFKFGYNGAPSTEGAETQPVFRESPSACRATWPTPASPDRAPARRSAAPGGLVRVNSAGNGRGAPYNPYSLTFADSLSRVMGTHFVKMGADVRLIRMSTDQLGGITYTFPNVTAFLAETADPGSVFRRLERTEPVPQRRHRAEAHQAGILRRLRAG